MRILRYLSPHELKILIDLATSDKKFWHLFKEEEKYSLVADPDNEEERSSLDTVELTIDFLNKNKIDHKDWTKGPLIIELRKIAREEIKKEVQQ